MRASQAYHTGDDAHERLLREGHEIVRIGAAEQS